MSAHTKTKGSGNSFADTLRGVANRVYGENGALKEGKTDYPHIQAMSDCVRSGTKPTDSELENARKWFRKVLKFASDNNDPIAARDAAVMMWAKRHRTEGEGEKAIMYEWFFELYDVFPAIVLAMIKADLFGMYGCYQDYNKLLMMISNKQWVISKCKRGSEWTSGQPCKYTVLAEAIRTTMLDARTKDLKKLDTYLKTVSQVEDATHWARKGLAGYASLPGEVRDGEDARSHMCRKYLDMVMTSKTIVSPDGKDTQTVYPYLDRVSTAVGSRVNPLDLSLIGKWVGSEGAKYARDVKVRYEDSSGHSIFDNYLNFMIRGGMKVRGPKGMQPFPLDRPVPNGAKKQWRIRNGALRAATNVSEVLMASNRFHELNFAHVASRCLKINSKAFLNELRKKAPSSAEELTGNRRPHEQSRVDCRANLRSFFTDKGAAKLNAAGLLPHEIGYQAGAAKSTADRDLHNTLWESKKIEVKTALQKVRDEIAAKEEDTAEIDKIMSSGNWLPCSDTSGSMTWGSSTYSYGSKELSAPHRAWDVSVGLGAFMSQCSSGPWEGLCLTFDSNPKIFDIRGLKASDAMTKITSTSRGYNTDFGKAMMTVLNHMVTHRVPEGEEPVLVVYSDGEFDDPQLNHQARSWQTTYEWLVEQYARKGRKRVPMIVWWNLKAERAGVQTKDHCPGVMHLQSKSPALFKYILYGEAMPDTEKTVMVDGKEVKMKTSSMTPYIGFRKTVDQPLWAPIDEILVREKSGIFGRFHGMPTDDV